MLVLGAIVHEKEEGRAVGRLPTRLSRNAWVSGVDPVEIFADGGARAGLDSRAAPRRLSASRVRWRRWGGIQSPATCGRPLAPPRVRAQAGRIGVRVGSSVHSLLVTRARICPASSRASEAKVGFEELTDGVIGSRLAIGGRRTFEQEPPQPIHGGQVGRKLVEEAGLPHPRLPHNSHELAVACTGELVRLTQEPRTRPVAPRNA